MTISELIDVLQDKLIIHGDREIVIRDADTEWMLKLEHDDIISDKGFVVFRPGYDKTVEENND